MTIKELKQQLGNLHDKMTAMQKKADDESRKMTAEETTAWDTMDADYNVLRADIIRREVSDKRAAELEGRVITPPVEARAPQPQTETLTTEEHQKRLKAAFTTWIRGGFEELSPEQRQLMAKRRASVDRAALPAEIRAAQSTTTTAGGYLIPQGFSELLEQFLKAFGGMRQNCRVFPTPDGRDIPWPTVDDTSNVGEIIAENSGHNTQDVTFGQVTLKAFKYSSKIVLVSVELLQDSFFDIDSLLAELLAVRIGRITNTHFTTGASPGTATPFGVAAQAGLGKLGLTGQSTSIISDDIYDLEHALDPAYRLNAKWMFADSTLKVIKKLKDSTGRMLWQPALAGMANPVPDTIDGKPYIINQDVAAMASSAKSVIFGDFDKYIIRDARDVSILRLVERYAELGQVGFLAFSRHDGRCLNTNAFKYYQNSAS